MRSFRIDIVVAIGIATLACSPRSGQTMAVRPLVAAPAPSTQAVGSGSSQASPAVAAELERLRPAILAAGVLQASGSDPGALENAIVQIARSIQGELGYEVTFESIVPHVRFAVQQASATPEARRAGASVANQRRLHERLFKSSPEVAAALEGEASAIEQAARLRNSKDTNEQGEALAREIATRVRTRTQTKTSPDAILVQVMSLVAQKQMTLAFGKRGPLGALLERQAAHAAEPIAAAFGKLGTVEIQAMPAAFVKAYDGDVAAALKLYRAEFERTAAILRLKPWQSADQSSLYRHVQLGGAILVDNVLTLTERNPTQAEFAALGYELVLTYKAKSSESERRVAAALAQAGDAGIANARQQWRTARERVAALTLKTAAPTNHAGADKVELQSARTAEVALVNRLVEASALGRSQDKPFEANASVRALEALLVTDEALLSYIEYRHVTPKDMAEPSRWTRSYGAFVLTREGLRWSSLGSAHDVERLTEAYLTSLSDPALAVAEKRLAAKRLYDRVFAPVAPHLTGKNKLRIVPDGQLQLVPFAALHDGTRWLDERFEVSYAFSERQLLGEHMPATALGVPLVLVPGPYSATQRKFVRGDRLSAEHFPTLPGALSEGRRVQSLLPGARLISGAAATKAVLFPQRPPSVVHLAGHGVFYPPATASSVPNRGVVFVEEGAPAASTNSIPNGGAVDADAAIAALLVMAPDATRGDDGLLTAFEAATAPLFGTRLLVLSACESGRGNPDRIRGFRGFRSAFYGAGVESLVMSLWSVSDKSTEELMAVFYEQLGRGVSRAESLRRASAAIRKRTEDPFHWAPFVLIGDTTAMSFSPTKERTSPADEDPESRLRRGMAFKRLKHTATRMGQATWSSAGKGTSDTALDAYVARDPAGRLIFTLLGKRESVALVVKDYSGPGAYRVEDGRLLAGVAPVSDPLSADIRSFGPDAAIKPASGALQVSDDSPRRGFKGRFQLRLKGRRELSGEFNLESTIPDLPDAMVRAQ